MARDFAKAFYNSKAWLDTRQWVLHRDGMICRECIKRGRVVPAAEVHHIIHLTPDNICDTSITMNMDNLVSLCRDCHFEEHRGEHAGGRKAQENEEPYNYTFDASGQLVPRA